MSNEEKIVWLKRYQASSREIDRLTEAVQRWGSRAARVTASVGLTRGSGDMDPLGKAVAAMVDIQRDLLAQIEKGEAAKAEIERAIARIEDDRMRQVMRYRYISGHTWEKIAVEMNYSYMHVCRMHGAALQQLNML